jgi:hypothetical protein
MIQITNVKVQQEKPIKALTKFINIIFLKAPQNSYEMKIRHTITEIKQVK